MMVHITVMIMAVEMAMPLTRYVLMMVLDQLIGGTHMIIRDLMVEHRIKVKIMVWDGLVVTTWSNLLMLMGFIRVITRIIHQSYGDTHSSTSIPYYRPLILQQDPPPVYDDIIYSFCGTRITEIILTNPGHPTSQAKIVIILTLNFSLITATPTNFIIIQDVMNLTMISPVQPARVSFW